MYVVLTYQMKAVPVSNTLGLYFGRLEWIPVAPSGRLGFGGYGYTEAY
jgi:hypothetical protein